MGRRLELQAELESLLGSRNVYFQPPPSIAMKYPAIRYQTNDIDSQFGDNKSYINMTQYQITCISLDPDDPLPAKLIEHFSYCTFDRWYAADQLNHNVLVLYY